VKESSLKKLINCQFISNW